MLKTMKRALNKSGLMALLMGTAIAAALGGALSSPAVAQGPRCVPHEAQMNHLAEKYSKSVAASGVHVSGQHLLEVAVNPETGDFTIVVADTQGCSAIVFEGQGWRTQEPVSTGPGA